MEINNIYKTFIINNKLKNLFCHCLIKTKDILSNNKEINYKSINHNDKVVINSPSIVAMDRSSKKIIAIGEEAKFMQGKTHENIKTIRPLKDGVIADFEASEKMISELI